MEGRLARFSPKSCPEKFDSGRMFSRVRGPPALRIPHTPPVSADAAGIRASGTDFETQIFGMARTYRRMLGGRDSRLRDDICDPTVLPNRGTNRPNHGPTRFRTTRPDYDASPKSAAAPRDDATAPHHRPPRRRVRSTLCRTALRFLWLLARAKRHQDRPQCVSVRPVRGRVEGGVAGP